MKVVIYPLLISHGRGGGPSSVWLRPSVRESLLFSMLEETLSAGTLRYLI